MDPIVEKALISLQNNLIQDEKINLDSEEDIIDFIEYRVAELLDREPELLMSYMYRLDVEEHKIQMALKMTSQVPIPRQLANLIWARQKQRAQTKMEHKKGNPNFWYE